MNLANMAFYINFHEPIQIINHDIALLTLYG